MDGTKIQTLDDIRQDPDHRRRRTRPALGTLLSCSQCTNEPRGSRRQEDSGTWAPWAIKLNPHSDHVAAVRQYYVGLRNVASVDSRGPPLDAESSSNFSPSLSASPLEGFRRCSVQVLTITTRIVLTSGQDDRGCRRRQAYRCPVQPLDTEFSRPTRQRRLRTRGGKTRKEISHSSRPGPGRTLRLAARGGVHGEAWRGNESDIARSSVVGDWYGDGEAEETGDKTGVESWRKHGGSAKL